MNTNKKLKKHISYPAATNDHYFSTPATKAIELQAEKPMPVMQYVFFLFILKGIVHLNIIFSYMKVNKICNLDHPVY